jgi:hypothetical protein
MFVPSGESWEVDLALKGLMQAVAVYNIATDPRASGPAETGMAG